MNLNRIITDIRSYSGITRKRPISTIVRNLPKDSYGQKITEWFGADSAALEMGDNMLLLTTDGIIPEIVERDPLWAGYCAILANVNDITAMGGKAIAATDVISMRSDFVGEGIAHGLSEGAKKFKVPIVAGHTNPACDYDAVDVSMLGVVKRDSAIYNHGAKPGNDIIAAIDLAGCIHKTFKYVWDTTTMKPTEEVHLRLNALREIGKRKIATSCKDISNAGALGTIGMLMELNGIGGAIDLTKIPVPDCLGLDFTQWLKMYQGCGFIVTCQPSNTEEVIKELKRCKLAADAVGNINNEKKMWLTDTKDTKLLFDFKEYSIAGIKNSGVI